MVGVKNYQEEIIIHDFDTPKSILFFLFPYESVKDTHQVGILVEKKNPLIPS
jgi:hypothetical protein